MADETDKFKKVGANTVTSLAAPGKDLAATSINVGATTNMPTDTGIVVGIRVVDSEGIGVPGTYTEWNGVVTSGTAIAIEATPVYGSDQVYAAGSTTQVFLNVSSSLHNQLVDGLLAEHKQDGTHKAVTADSIVTTGDVTSGGDVVVGDDIKVADGKSINDGNDNELVVFQQTASAVNELEITNAATGNAPQIAATGDDTDISMRLKAKGAGTVQPGLPVAFHAYRNAVKSIGNSVVDVVHDTELFDYGSNFNTTTGVFTAPYAGVYHFDTGLNGENASNRVYLNFICSTAGTFTVFDTDAINRKASGSLTINLAASETVKVGALVSSTVDVAGTETFFAGYLVGRTN